MNLATVYHYSMVMTSLSSADSVHVKFAFLATTHEYFKLTQMSFTAIAKRLW